jgi:putative acetyltransferase
MSHGTIAIRAERPDHPEVVRLLDALDEYLGSLYAPEDNHILDLQALRSADVDFLVADVDGGIVGCGAARRMPGEPATDGVAYGEIKRMYVDPAHRGRRIGEQLIGALEARLAGQGIRRALLETGRDQREAVRLYERCGYRRRPAFAGYPDNGLSVFYEKSLQAP